MDTDSRPASAYCPYLDAGRVPSIVEKAMDDPQKDLDEQVQRIRRKLLDQS